MKKKIALLLAVVLVVAVFGLVVAACDSGGLSDDTLQVLLTEVSKYHRNDPKKTDANFSVIGKISTLTDDGEVEVDISWKSSSDKVTISSEMNGTGFYTVTIPDRTTLTEDLEYTLTATLVDAGGTEYKNSDGDVYSVSFERIVTKYNAETEIVDTLTTGNYKIIMRDEVNDKTWYAKGDISLGYYLAITDDKTDASVFTVTVDNGQYTIQVGGKYLEAYKSGSFVDLRLVDAPSTSNDVLPFTWNQLYKTFYIDNDGITQFLGVNYSTGTTTLYRKAIGASKIDYIAGDTNFPIHFVATDEQGGVDQSSKYGIKQATQYEADTDYYLGLYNTNFEKWYFFAGDMNNFYYEVSSNKDKAAVVVLEEQGDGFYIKVKSTGKYLTLGPRDGDYSKSTLSLDDTASTVWKYDETTKCFTTELTNGTNTYKFYLGNYGNNNELSGLATFYDGNYPALLGDIVAASEATTPDSQGGDVGGGDDGDESTFTFGAWTEGKEGEVYLQVTVDDVTYFVTGSMGDTYYLATSQDATKAGKFTVAVSGDGYTIKTPDNKFLEAIFKTNSSNASNPYIDIKLNSTQTDGCIWKWDATLKTFTMQGIGDFTSYTAYLGLFKQNGSLKRQSVGASSTYYVVDDNAANIGVTQFICQFGDLTVEGGSQGGDDGGDVDVPERPTDTVAVSIKSTDLQILDNSQDSAYNKYKGDQTVGDFTINIAGIMVNTMTKPADVGVVQFKNNDGTLKITGKFTTLYIVGYCTKVYSEKTFIVTVDGTAVAAEKYVGATETGDYADFQNSCYKITLLVTLDMSEAKEVVVKSNGGGAFYATEVTFFGEGGGSQGGGGGDVDPDPTPSDEPEHITGLTIEQFLGDQKPSAGYLAIYELEGVWVPTGNSGDKYGNGLLVDPETGKSIVIYGLADSVSACVWDSTTQKYTFTNPQKYQDLLTQMQPGDKIKVGGVWESGYGGELKAYFISREEVKANLIYEITTDIDAEKGSVSLSKESGFIYGDEVTVTVNVNEGVQIVDVKFNDEVVKAEADGKTFKVTVAVGPNKLVVTLAAEGEKVTKTITIDFTSKSTNLKDTIGFTANTAQPFEFGDDVTTLQLQGYNIKKASGADKDEYAYIMMNKSAKGSYVANTAAVPGYITKIEFVIPSGSSSKVTYYGTLSKTAVLEAQTTGTSLKGTGELITMEITATEEDQFSFFNFSTKDSSNNGQIAKIIITYVEA